MKAIRLWMILVHLGIVAALFCGCQKDANDGIDISDAAVAFAETHWTYYDSAGGEFGSYLAYEYWVGTLFGADGELSGTVVFNGTIDEWQTMSWDQRRAFLPAAGFPDELILINRDQRYYDLIGQSDQFAAGWPADGDNPYNYRILTHYTYPWTASNSYRNAYLNMIGGGGN